MIKKEGKQDEKDDIKQAIYLEAGEEQLRQFCLLPVLLFAVRDRVSLW
jgi:hypothetical protein